MPGAAVAFGWLMPDTDPRVIGLSAMSMDGWTVRLHLFGEPRQLSFDSIGE